MKKAIWTVFLFALVMTVVPFALEGPVERGLQAAGASTAYSYEISLAAVAAAFFLLACRKRFRAGRQRRREARAARREKRRIRNSYVLSLTPYEYEEYVAEELRQEGFTGVDTTPKSGDYGADVLAWDGDRKVCVQCKRYAPDHPVGVKAVQEVYSAKDYYGCDDAYIYTTSDYTRAAVDMANQLGVILIRTAL